MAEQTRSRYILTLGILLALAFLLGYDIQMVSATAPRLIQILQINSKQLGTVFSASNFGLFFGSLLGGRLGDRFGYRNMLLAATIVFGVGTLLTAGVTAFVPMVMVRAICGLGFGCALPNLLSTSTLISSSQARFSVTATVFWAIPFGGLAVAGTAYAFPASASIVWIYLLGGVLTLGCVPIGLLVLPDGHAPINKLASRGGGIINTLFSDGRLVTTLLIWLAFISSYVSSYIMSNWFTIFATHRGIAREHAPLVLVGYSVSGIFGTLIIGRLADRFGPRWPIAIAWIVASLAMLSLAVDESPNVIFPVAAIVGFMSSGACISLYALTTFYYPASARGLGAGAGIGSARIGAIVGPLYAGFLLDAGYSVNQVIVLPAGAAIVACIAIIALSFRPSIDAEPAPI